MKRITLIIYLTFFAIVGAFAIPAKPGIHTRTQSDGSIVTYEVFGDEYHHYTLADGIYTVVEDEIGDLCYATIKDNRLVSSGVKVRSTSKLSDREKSIAAQSIGLRPFKDTNALFTRERHSAERAIANRIKEQAASLVAPNEQALQIAGWGGEVLGDRKLLVILVGYKDHSFTIDNPRDKFDNLLNQEGYSANGSNGSVADYFKDASNNKFTPSFDVVGPFTLPNNRKYYGANDGYGGDDARPALQTVHACNLAEESGVDFSQYDGNNDGKIDLVFIVYAGHNEAEGGPKDSVWPHQWEIYPGNGGNIGDIYTQPEYDGKKLVSYSCSSELSGPSGSQMCNIGTFCHEFGHAIGLPDWYDTENNACLGLSLASIMNSGNYLNESRTPPTYNIIERWLMGWAFPKEIKEMGLYELEHVSKDDGYIIWANDSKTECFLFEARTKGANYKWDKYLNAGDKRMGYQGGEGMLVYHLDWDSTPYSTNPKEGSAYEKWKSHSINTDISHECARLFRAKPSALAETSQGWFFPGSGKVTTLSFDTTPKFQNWDGEKMPFQLSNIAVAGDKVTFSVLVNELSFDARQYDTTIDWRASRENFDEWEVVCTDKATQEVVYSKTTTNKYINIYPLQPSSKYHVTITGKGSTEPTFILDIETQSNILIPMSSLNVASSHKEGDLIRLSVKNLDFTMDNIVWYVDGEISEDAYISPAAGKHQICAVLTDTEGNTHYLYRTINVH